MNLPIEAILLLASLFAGASVIILVYLLTPKKVNISKADFQAVEVRGHLGTKRNDLMKRYPLYKMSLPFITFVAKLHKRMNRKAYYQKMIKKLNAAGNPGAYSADDIVGLRVLLAVVMPFVVLFMIEALAIMQEGGKPLAMIIGSVFGAFYPTLWIGDTITKRQKSINRTLPYTLDLLTLSIEAGLDFIGAMERIVHKKKDRDPLSEELFQVLQELKMGKTRREALKDMAIRCNNENLSSVVSALVQADQLGTSLGPVLRIQAEMLRVRRSQRAEKLAMEAPVKMMFPLLFIFASVFLLMFGPTIVKALRGELF